MDSNGIAISFQNLLELEKLLKDFNIDTATWDSGQARTEQLYTELKIKDSELLIKNNHLVRNVTFLIIFIRNDDLVLIKQEQILPNGSKKDREISLFSKIKRNTIFDTDLILDAVDEELSLQGSTYETNVKKNLSVMLYSAPYECPKRIINSISYPGIVCENNAFTIDISIPELPPTEFTSFKKTEDGYVTNQWMWVDTKTALRYCDKMLIK
jgi:hypothetical protein